MGRPMGAADGGCGGAAITVTPLQSHDATSGPSEGRFTATAPGILELQWSNAFSYVLSKSLSFRISLSGKAEQLGDAIIE